MNRFVCHNCGKEFEQADFSDEIWKLFCSFGCLFGWCRAHMPKPRPVPPFVGEKQEPANSE